MSAGAAKAGAAVGASATAFTRVAPKTACKLGSAWEELEDAARQRAVKLLLRALRRAMRRIEALSTVVAQEELDVSPESFPGRAVAGAVRRLSNDVFSERLLPKLVTDTVLRRPAEAPLDSPPPKCCTCPGGPLARSRAFLRYHLVPFDKGLFGTLRDPAHLLLLCLASFPWWWVSLAWWRSSLTKPTQLDRPGLLRLTLQGFWLRYAPATSGLARSGPHGRLRRGPGARPQLPILRPISLTSCRSRCLERLGGSLCSCCCSTCGTLSSWSISSSASRSLSSSAPSSR